MTLITHTAAILSSFVLLLPAGWCCAPLQASVPAAKAAALANVTLGEAPVAACPACRHHKAASLASQSSSRPASPRPSGMPCHAPTDRVPTASCCCVRHVVAPETVRIEADQFAIWASLPVALVAAPQMSITTLQRLTEPIYAGPRLQLLYCLWLK